MVVKSSIMLFSRELKQTTMATEMRMSPNKRYNEQNNDSAQTLNYFPHFFAILCRQCEMTMLCI